MEINRHTMMSRNVSYTNTYRLAKSIPNLALQ